MAIIKLFCNGRFVGIAHNIELKSNKLSLSDFLLVNDSVVITSVQFDLDLTQSKLISSRDTMVLNLEDYAER